MLSVGAVRGLEGCSGAAMLTDCACIAVCVCGWDAADNRIGKAAYARMDAALRVCAAAPLAAARCRLAFAMGFVFRLCEDSVLADVPIDCISASASCCSTQLVLRFWMAQSTERSGAMEKRLPRSAHEEGVPPLHVSGA